MVIKSSATLDVRGQRHENERGKRENVVTRGLTPVLLGGLPLKLGALGAGSPRESGGREIVLSGSVPGGEIMGGAGGGENGGGYTPAPQPTMAPPSGKPRSSEGGRGKTKPLWAPHPQD